MFPGPSPAAPDFNPRSPCGERRLSVVPVFISSRFQSTLPMRGATVSGLPVPVAFMISIHAPHAGSDPPCMIYTGYFCDFNPRSPCGERLRRKPGVCQNLLFQSTLPMRGATLVLVRSIDGNGISIHAPHAGSDRAGPGIYPGDHDFNPRSPCGERLCMYAQNAGGPYFNPRSPCGERLNSYVTTVQGKLFQSTLPMRGATSYSFLRGILEVFQSTLPMRGATVKQKTLNPCGIQHIILRTS